jgi:hypothetical protein
MMIHPDPICRIAGGEDHILPAAVQHENSPETHSIPLWSPAISCLLAETT